MKELGEKIKQLRKEQKLSQTELAEKCGYKHFTTIHKIEKGEIYPSFENTIILSQVLNVSPAYLMGLERRKTKEEEKLLEIIGQLNEEEVKELYIIVEYVLSKRK